jgi:hypothetical protein
MRPTFCQYPAFVLAAFASASVLAAEPPGSQYAGEERRSIKALSEDETAALLSGQGSGFAKAAELNGYPGPAHVLELAIKLGLAPDQLAATQALMSAHRRRAQQIGAELVAAEKDLDALFAERLAGTASVDQATLKVAVLQGRLRAEHLKTHLLEHAILTPAQVEQYARLRGYEPTPGIASPAAGDAASTGHKHH